MREVALKTPGLVALVDDEDYDLVSQLSWSANGPNNYPYNSTTHLLLHHVVMLSFEEFDHIDLDGLNNQKSNLRPCSRSLNMFNVEKKAGTYTSKYKGVSWAKHARLWRCTVTKDYKQIHIGYYPSAEDAALAYNAAASQLVGEFARLNHIPSS